MPSLEDLVAADVNHDCSKDSPDTLCVRMLGVADLPSEFGTFRIIAFSNNRDQKEHVAITKGDIIGQQAVPTRLHSECLTGDVMGSLRCDCRAQLKKSLEYIASQPCGLVLYLRQEGRGIGLINKIRAYSLQDQGLDTVDANLALGFQDDERDYAIAAHMLRSLQVGSVQVMTNNPRKIKELERHGVSVVGRLPHIIPPNVHNHHYLQTKATRSGHWIDLPNLQQAS